MIIFFLIRSFCKNFMPILLLGLSLNCLSHQGLMLPNYPPTTMEGGVSCPWLVAILKGSSLERFSTLSKMEKNFMPILAIIILSRDVGPYKKGKKVKGCWTSMSRLLQILVQMVQRTSTNHGPWNKIFLLSFLQLCSA